MNGTTRSDTSATRSRGRAPVALLLSVAAIAAVASLAAWRRQSVADRRVELGVSALRISLPVYVAHARGFFARRGLDVRLRSFVTAQPMVDDVARGRLDAAGFAAYPIVALSASRSGRTLHVATSLLEDPAHRLSYVLARRGSGLRFPGDAPGRRIGVLPTVAYQRWLAAVLRAAAVDPSRVTVVPVDPTMQSMALRSGAVDLLFTGDPMATAMLHRGLAEVADDGPPCARRLGSPFAFGALVLSDALVSNRPSVARALVEAVDEAVRFARADEPAGRGNMAPYLRPEERPAVGLYPPSRYLQSTEVPPGFVDAEVVRERDLGILGSDIRVPLRAWAGAP